MKLTGIYMISNLATDEVYIGASAVDIKKRWSTHNSNIKSGKFRYKSFVDAYKADANNIKFEILEECDKDSIQKAEQSAINYIKHTAFKCVNKNKAGKIPFNSDEAKCNKSNSQRGELNGNAKLNRCDVILMKQMYRDGASVKVLSQMFDVSETHIRAICIYKTKWKEVEIDV